MALLFNNMKIKYHISALSKNKIFVLFLGFLLIFLGFLLAFQGFKNVGYRSKISMEDRNDSMRLSRREPRKSIELTSEHKRFRVGLMSASMPHENLSELLGNANYLKKSEVLLLINQCGFDLIINYLLSLPSTDNHNHYNNKTIRYHISHMLLDKSENDFLESIKIMPSLSGESGIQSRVMALDLIYPERQLGKRMREVGIDYDQFVNHSDLYFLTLYHNLHSVDKVIKAVESTENGKRDLVESLKQVDLSELPPRSSKEGIDLFDYLQKIKNEDESFYNLSGIEEILEPWISR